MFLFKILVVFVVSVKISLAMQWFPPTPDLSGFAGRDEMHAHVHGALENFRRELQGSTTVEAATIETSLDDLTKPTRAVDGFESAQGLAGKRHLQSIVGVADRKEGPSQALPPKLEAASSPWQRFREWQGREDNRDNGIMKYLEHLLDLLRK
jgi:hypothetical protein